MRALDKFSRPLFRAAAVAALTALSVGTQAAPLNLSNTPLFLGTTVPPNIFLEIDDSGSMDWETLYSNGAMAADSLNNASGTDSLDHTPNNSTEEKRLCWGYNTLAYDPNKTYTPWKGEDDNHATFADQPVDNALSNPYLHSGTKVDLRHQFYFVWNDDGDGVYQDGECPTPSISGSYFSYTDCQALSDSECVVVGDMTSAQQTNYANWYSYYRKRIYVAKRALSQVIYDSSARMGLGSINSHFTRTAIKYVDDISTPVNSTYHANKVTLLKNLAAGSASGGTPLRNGLKWAGEYYAGNQGASWPTPILSQADGGECQQNFTILMTDGYWNGGSPDVGNTDGDSSSMWDHDNGIHNLYTETGFGYDGDYDYNYTSVSDTYSNRLADVAMKYYETDLSALDNDVPTTTGVDMNPAQHMVTYTVSFGTNGTLTANPSSYDTTFTWPAVGADTLTTIDDLRHAAWDSHGKYLSAADPQGLIDSINEAISNIADRVGSGAAVSFNTSSVQEGTMVYVSLFNSSRWSGNVKGYPLDTTTGAIQGSATWDAADTLDNRNLSTSPRTLLTYDSSSQTGIPFEWANLTSAEKNDLKTNSAGGSDNDATGMARLGFLRGDRSCEVDSTTTCSYTDGTNTYSAKNLRTRGSRLGDIIDSSPVFVGAANLGWPDSAPFPSATGETYSDFKTAEANRKGVLYVAANDGMLHAFRAEDSSTTSTPAGDNSKEILGYVPSMLFSTGTGEGLHYLTEQGYIHRYYADLTPTISDAYIKTRSDSSPHWATVLVGGLRGGGKGLYALDVTDPNSFSEDTSAGAPGDTVLWEFTNADLGYTFSRPIIVLTNAVDSSGNHRWAAVFGNGYNNSGSGHAELFVVFLDGGIDGTWTDGSGTSDLDYVVIDTDPGGTYGDSTTPNGLSSTAVIDTSGDGTADRVYAGDLTGNMWAFDLSDSDPTKWGVAYKSGSTPVPLFTAKDGTTSSANTQPITVTPIVVKNPLVSDSASNDPNVLVLFGTGQYMVDTDKTSSGTQTFYGVWDDGSHKSLTRADLQEQTFQSGFPSDVRVLSSNSVNYTGSGSSQQFGWYIDLPESHERVITDAVARGSIVYFDTTIPTTQVCSIGAGGWLMSVSYATGGNPSTPVFDYNGDGTVDSNDVAANSDTSVASAAPAGKQFHHDLPAAPAFLGNRRYVAGTGGTTSGDAPVEDDAVEALVGQKTGRLSWEELQQ